MRIKAMILLVCFTLTFFALSSCGNDGPSVSGTPSDDVQTSVDTPSDVSENVTDEESSEIGTEESSEVIIDRTWPYVTGDFIQPWAFSALNSKKWEQHCDYLVEAGIDTVILQWSVTDTNGELDGAYYPCTLDGKKFNYVMVEKLLDACEKKGIRVFMGLNAPSNWFEMTLTDAEWCRREGELGVRVARDLYDKYKSKYPNAFYGWYFNPEYYGGIGNVEQGAAFLNIYLDGLTGIDPSLPFMMSPFLRIACSPEDTRDEWIEIFKNTHFREGDIFCCQDSVGAGGIPLKSLDAYFKCLKEAVDTKEGLHFWANNENFTTTGKSSEMERFASQLEISDKYVEGHVTFAYSHYYAPDIVGNTRLHEEYVHYYNTGEYTKRPENKFEYYEGAKTLVSEGKKYTGTISTRGDKWDDDGQKLTDGKILDANGNSTLYFGTGADSFDVIIDLGEKIDNIYEFDVYNAFGTWGISKMEAVTFYVSDDGRNWTQAGDTVESYKLDVKETIGEWQLYEFRTVTREAVSGRYVKAALENSGWLWISEICVYTYDELE